MIKIFRTMVLLTMLLALATQVVGSAHHVHGPNDHDHCTLCMHGGATGEPALQIVDGLPPDAHQRATALAAGQVAPPPSLDPLDVSFSTSPPVA